MIRSPDTMMSTEGAYVRFDVITIFPDMFPGPVGEGVIGKAIDRGLVRLCVHDLRRWADPPHYKVDDEPFGGGAGMVFTPQPVFDAVESVRRELQQQGSQPGPVVLMSPQGRRLSHGSVQRLAQTGQITLICGRYEGVDERIRAHLVDEEISIGDFVLSGGELPAMVLIEAATRLLPEALGDPASARQDSFVEGLLDHPHYTRPAEFRGWQVPEVLRSGNHAAIRAWRRREALRNTFRKRPDLIDLGSLDDEERAFLKRLEKCGPDKDKESDRDADETALK